jgi:uracil-DNA glycosylase
MLLSIQNQIPSLPASWKKKIEYDFSSVYSFLEKELSNDKTIYPPLHMVFRAFELTDFESVKVVILGQDPYHGEAQAEGLSFSVSKGIALPPSLKNIFKELKDDIGCNQPKDGSLVNWAKQGVLLLNTILTVRKDIPKSHHNIGWEKFTDKVISSLNDRNDPLVFILWGTSAIQKTRMIDGKHHLILTAPHPSPLSSYRGFLGCRHFSLTNQFLLKVGKKPIDWDLSDVE